MGGLKDRSKRKALEGVSCEDVHGPTAQHPDPQSWSTKHQGWLEPRKSCGYVRRLVNWGQERRGYFILDFRHLPLAAAASSVPVVIPPLRLSLPNSRTSSERTVLTGPGTPATGTGTPATGTRGDLAAQGGGVAAALAGGATSPVTRPAAQSPLFIGQPRKLRPRPARAASPRGLGAGPPLAGPGGPAPRGGSPVYAGTGVSCANAGPGSALRELLASRADRLRRRADSRKAVSRSCARTH